MTISSPTVFYYRLELSAVSKQAYAEADAIFDDLAAAYRKAVQAFYDAGCRYLQFDDTAWAYLCSVTEMKQAKERGIKTDRVTADYATLISKSISGKLADMVITTHACRGNFRSSSIAEGGYEPVADRLLGGIDYDGYFLEYDTERAGGFEPLRFLPKGNKMVVLGLITSKSGTLEKRMTSSGGLTTRPNTRHLHSSRSARNAALLRPRRATCWPRTSNGPSCP
jgi:5-methyltetrahydropteroyltriglutamate--homocysteine methyltransferase